MKKIMFLILFAFLSCTSDNEEYNDEGFDTDSEFLKVKIEIIGEGNSAPDHATSIYLYHSKDSNEGWVDNKVIVKESENSFVPLPYNKTVTIEKHPEGGRVFLRGGFYGCITVSKLDLFINGERVCRKSYTSRSNDCSGSLYNLSCDYEY